MYYLLRLLIFFLFLLPATVFSQSLTVSVAGNTSANGASTFSLAGGEVTISSSSISFGNGKSINGMAAFGISSDLSVVGVLRKSVNGSHAVIIDAGGATLAEFPVINLGSNDPSIAIYPFNTGGALVRDNIASFNFYDSFGNNTGRLSSSSQSEGGEAISEVAADPAGETVVIYTPQINREGQIGSHAQLVDQNGNLKSLYFKTDRTIKAVEISNDGQFIVVISSGDEGAQAHFMDRFGNELNTISSEEDLIGARLTDDARYLTLFSSGRVLVMDSMTGERIGSTSLRSPVVIADYFPADDMLMVMTASYSESSGIANDIQFHAIDVEKRQIARQDFGGGLKFNSSIKKQLTRQGSNRYRLTGANKLLNLRASF